MDGEGDIPRTIWRQQWSAFNVPFVWAAASGDRDCPLLLLLSHTASTGPSIQVGGVEMSVMTQCTPVGTHCTRQ